MKRPLHLSISAFGDLFASFMPNQVGRPSFLFGKALLVLLGIIPIMNSLQAQSISTGTVTTSPFCPGDAISIPFTVDTSGRSFGAAAGPAGGPTSITYVAQLSDISGGFGTVTTLASTTSTSGSNKAAITALSINTTIPAGLPYSSTYRVRVIKTLPGTTNQNVVGNNITINPNSNGNLTIRAAGLTGLIPTAPATICQGADYDLQFSNTNTFIGGNIFIVELDNNINFTSPVNIGILASTSPSGTIKTVIPFTESGTGYYIRYRATNSVPANFVSCPIGPYTIPAVRPFTDPINDLECTGGNASFTVSGGADSYQWQKVCSQPFTNVTMGLGGSGVSFDIAKDGVDVFAATPTELSISRNSGATFTEHKLVGQTVNKVFVVGNNVYAATNMGIFISNDNGGNFGPPVNTSGPNFLPQNNITAIAVSGGVVYAGTGSGGLAIGTPGSAFTVRTTANGLGSNVIFDVFVDGVYVYVATQGGLSVSSDGGTSFTNYTTADGLGSNIVYSVFQRDNIIYAGTDFGFAYATSYNNTPDLIFTNILGGLGSPVVRDIFVSGSRIYAATTGGLSVANVGSTAFTNIIVGMVTPNVWGVVEDGGAVLLATLGGVAYTTFTTTPLAGGPGVNNINFAVTPADSWCRFQVIVSTGGCSLVSNQVRVADIPPNITAVGTGPAGVGDGPTTCGGVNGEIKISGLVPFTKYRLVYTGANGFTDSGDTITANAQGEFLNTLFPAGSYDLSVQSLVNPPVPACFSNVFNVVLNDPLPPSAVTANLLDASICAGENISVNLAPQLLNVVNPGPPAVPVNVEQFKWYTDLLGTTPANPATTTALTYSPMVAPGVGPGSIFVRKRDVVTLCDGPMLTLNYTVNRKPSISHAKTDPSSAVATDGTITISLGANPGTGPFTLQYTLPNGVTVVTVNNAVFPYTIMNLGIGNYTAFSVTNSEGCQSNIIASCPLLPPPPPDVIGGKVLQTVVCEIPGTTGGYFQQAEEVCASDQLVDEGAGSIAVGRIRRTSINPVNDEKVEMRGFVQFDLNAFVPKNATIEKIEYRPTSLTGGFQQVCEVDVVNTGATGDIQFDITQVKANNYAPYIGYQQSVNDDLYDVKYNDFVIAKDAIGALTDLGPQGVIDAQQRLNDDGIFQVGLALSGNDFDLPVYQFHGIVFAPSGGHTLCITYTLKDYGDLPEPKFATDLAGGLVGPSHRIDLIDINTDPNAETFAPAMFIGTTPPDGEADGQPSVFADGDNNDDVNDEDINSAWFSNPATDDSLIAGNTITLSFPVTNNLPGSVNVIAFFDWNNNGVFENDTERYSTTAPTGASTVTFLDLQIPIYATGNVGVRVRMTSGAVFDAYGPAPDGEVEDYLLRGIAGFDYADLPDSEPTLTPGATGIGNYETIFAIDGSRGPRHLINPNLRIGNTVDAELDGQPQTNAFGDDINGIDDEDGVIQPDSVVRGKPARFKVFVTNKTMTNAYLKGFVDWNNDGSFEDASPNQKSATITIMPGFSGYYDVIFQVPVDPNPLPERVAARFRLAGPSIGDPLNTGFVAVQSSLGPEQGVDFDIIGEVEDSWVTIVGYDWGDLGEPRYITDNEGGQPGPSHKIYAIDNGAGPVTSLYIGAIPPDAEPEGNPNQPATGDDNNGVDDEDLSANNFLNPTTLLPYPLIATDSTVLRIPVTNNFLNKAATLWAFIDWNGDGQFNGVTETYQRTVAAGFNGNVNFGIRIPNIAQPDSIGVRIRLTSGNIVDAYGQAPDGEVEDFMVELRGAEYGDLPDATAGTGNNDYQTLRVYNGPRHGVPVTPLVFMGKVIDTEADGQPTERANGDDNNQVPDDEDGIIFLGPLVPGDSTQLSFSGTNNTLDTATLHIWADWNSDGILEYVDSVEIGPMTTVAGQIVNFDVPASATFAGGKVFFRFRFTTDTPFNNVPSPNGSAADGEVEDYFLPIFKIGNLVWEDRNHNGLQDAEEINLGIQNVRVVLRYGGVDPITGEYDKVTQSTATDPKIKMPLDGSGDAVVDSILQVYTDAKGLYCFTGLIEGLYQIISVDTFGLTPTRFDHIKNVTEEDLDSDGRPLKNPWAYLSGERRQSKSQVFELKIDLIGTDEEGILDQGNPQLLDPNAVGALPDDRVEQRIDFGYVGLDLGDLAESGNNPSVTNFITTESGTKPEGPKHIVTPDLRLGKYQDVEWQGQPDQDAGAEFKPAPDAGGDDPIADFSNYPNFPYDPSQGRHWPFHIADDHDDEDGIRFLTPMVAGYDAIISVKYNAKINLDGPDAYLHAWFDWNGDGNFDDGAGNIDANEHIIFYKRDGVVVPNMLEPNTQAVKLEMSYLTSSTDSLTLTFKVPANVAYNNGNILSRFRISFDPHLGPNGILIPNGTLPPNQNFPDPQPGAIIPGTDVPGGIIPYGEVEDYFISLSKVGNTVFEDRDYDGFQDVLEPGIKNVPIKLQFAGADGILNSGDPYEFTYHDTTDATGRYYFCGLIGNVDPSGIPNPVYQLIVEDPAGMTATFNNPDPSDDACIDDNSNGDDLLIDNRITTDTFTITNPMMLCLDENAPLNDVGGDRLVGSFLPPSIDALNNFPDNQYDETRDFGYTGFDYGDLPVMATLPGSKYLTLRDSMNALFSGKFGPRHAIQPRLYLGKGVDGELNGKPDADAGSKAGGDDDDQGAFKKGATADDETGVRLLTPLLPGEIAYIKVNYTSQDTSAGGYINKTAYLDAFIDWDGNGVMDPTDKVSFTHQLNSNAVFSTNNVPVIVTTTPSTPSLIATNATGVDSTILGFRVPKTAVFDSGTVFMRFRLGWTNYKSSFPNSFPNGLGPDNNIFHMATSPYVKAYEPFNDVVLPDVVPNLGRYPYPQGEVEDYAIPVAKIGNLAWFDHDVFGDQDRNEEVVDSLHLVLIWGGVDNTSGVFDTVGYQTSLSSLGAVNDIRYNFTITPNANGLYTDPALIKTGISGMPSMNPDSGLYSFRGLIPGIYYVLPRKYFETDSASFVNAWPKHRVVTLQDNPGVDDNNDSDGNTKGVLGTSRGPGAFVKITDGNSRQPEVCVNDRPLLETGMRDTADLVEKLTPAFFPDNQWDRSVDIGWVDEPNVEASMDIVGVNFPTSQICGNFNVITHFCVKNPQEVPLDSFQMFFNLLNAYGPALYTASKPIVTIVDSAFVTKPVPNVKVRKSSLVNFKSAVNAKPKDLLVVNPNYNGTTDTKLLVPTSENAHFLLRGDSVLCVQIEFEIDPTKTASYPWMLSGLVSARAVGFNKANGDKRPLTDFRYFHPRFGKTIVVYDSTDEFDDPMPMAGLDYPQGGDCILFEGKVADRGLKGDYQAFPPAVEFVSTGLDKYADEDDKAIQNDSCWFKTKWNSGYKEFTIALDANCQAVVNADLLVPNFIAACGFDKYPMGSYYRVIIQDKWTEETLWASVDRIPFDVNKYLDRQLIYKVRSVANHCNVVWGPIVFTDKIPPVVTCPPTTSRKVNSKKVIVGTYTFVCTDIDSIYNVERSWNDSTYAYHTGLATATDACGVPRLEFIKDEIIYLSDCNESATNGYIYAQIRRTFGFIDRMGNKANCSQLINFYRPTIKLPDCKISVPNDKANGDTLILPIDLVGKKYNIKESVPYFINGSGDTIYITGKDYCGFSFNYTDQAYFETGQGRCGKKIIRTWSIFDWCYGNGSNYPNYTMQPGSNNECYVGTSWAGGRYTWQQTIIVGDDKKPVISALDVDRDGHTGRYEGAPQADPKVSIPATLNSPLSYDADDVLIYSTGPMDCTGNFLFTRDHFKVIEQSDWCFDIRVVERVAILDLDERPTGQFVLKTHPFVKITGDCAKGYTVVGVPMKGDWFVEVRVYDACYQENTALIPVRIMDLISPVMVCDDKLNVTLDNLGNGFVSAKDFDEGSWDNCNKLEWVKVRRPVQDACVATLLKFPRVVDANKNGKIDPYDPSKGLVDVNGNGKNDDYDYIDLNSDRIPQLNEYFTIGEYFTKNPPAAGNGSGMIMTPLMDTVPFFCCDGGSLMVELWGRDKFLNYNYCWNNVQLEDKTAIECIAPWEETVYCDDKRLAFIDDLKLSAKAFGDVVIVRGAVCIIADTAYTTVKKLKCGAGTIERIWTLTKQTAHGPVVTTCKQIIRVLPLREYNICFPKDTDQRDCKQPVVDSATVRELGCDILAVNVSEKRYDASDDECYKIFRTYTIINWCTYNDACGDPMDPSNLHRCKYTS